MIKLNDIIEVHIEKLSHDFSGIARYGEEKFVIFIKNALPLDDLKIKIVSLNKHYAKGEIVEIINSPNRIKPFCALYNACGSCEVQICDYEFSLLQKQLILKEIFKTVVDENKIYPIIKSPKLFEYRKKVQYPARRTKNSKRMLMGYYKNNSHDLTNIKFCPIVPKVTNELAEFIRQNFPFDCYSEKTNKGFLKNVLFRYNELNEVLITFVINEKSYKENKQFIDFCTKLKNNFLNIKGVFVNLNPYNSNKILGAETVKILGDDYIIEKLKDKSYKIGSTGFFQVNPPAASEIFEVIKNNINDNSKILDVYGGVGAIGIFVSEKASKITLLEENENALEMAKDNFELNSIKNYEIIKGDAIKNLADIKELFDCAIVDPPRSGCDKKGLKVLSEIAKKIIYLSCNPITLKRDLDYLKDLGYTPQFIQGADFFPYTRHIECLCVFERAC